MQLYYCNTCSKLIAPGLIDSGQVKIEEEKPVVCPSCRAPETAEPRRVRITPAPTRSSPSKGTRVQPPAQGSLLRARTPSERGNRQNSSLLLIIGLVLGGIVIVGILLAVLGRHTPPVRKAATAQAQTGSGDGANDSRDESAPRDFRGPGFLTPAKKPQDVKPDSVRGRYVRIELPGDRRVLSLAEVEVFCGDEDIAPKGKATQSSTAYDAPAGRAIDGRIDGAFFNGSVTHTNEEANPWWELDLGGDFDIRKIVVHNRTDENLALADRLADFSLTILDSGRKTVWRKERVPTPKPYYVLFPK